MMAMSGSVSFESEDKKDTKDLLERYVQCAEYLMDKCRDLSHITGAQKLERKCFAELKYLRSLSRRGGGFDVSHLRSSNLSHYLGVVHAAENLPEVTQILQAFRCPGRSEPLHVDVVAGQGHLWVKVIARKGQALHLIWAGQGQYGERDILLQAEDYVLCSTSHPVNFVDPKVVFAFYNGVTVDMVRAFIKANVIVLGNKVEVDADIQEKLTKIGIDTDSDSESDSDSVTVDKLENEGRMPAEHCLGNILKDNHSQTTGMPTNVGLAISSVDESGGTQSDNSKLDPIKSETENAKMNFDQLQDRSPKAQSDICLLDVSTDLSSRDLVRACPIDSIVTQKPQNCSNSTSESIDSNIFLLESPKTQTKEQSEKTNNNRLNISSIGPLHQSNMSDDVNLSNIQFQTPIEWQNESIKNKVQRSDKWDSGSGYVPSFIERELLTFPLVNYALLDSVLMKNKENTVENILRVNLDITALITLVSAVSHGGCFFEFKEKILSEQAAEERQEPVLPRLESFLKGKELYACDTAIESFQTILNTLGGNAEKVRSATLMKTLNVVKDNPSFRTSTLPNTGKIKDRSKIIFGTGDSLRAVTVTANSGFVRAAEHQGVLFAVFLHASRALTEEKEKTAKRISKADVSSD